MASVIARAEDFTDKMVITSMILANDTMRECAKTAPAVFSVMMLVETVFAAGDESQNGDATTQAITGVLNVLYLVTNVIGVIFVLVGLVRLAIAHSQEDAPGQQKAAMFIGTGIALILIKTAFSSISPETWINK